MDFNRTLELLSEGFSYVTHNNQKYVIAGESADKKQLKAIPVYHNSDTNGWDVAITGQQEHEPLSNYTKAELLDNFDKFSKTVSFPKERR